MKDLVTDPRRTYLRDFLQAQGVALKHASLALGRGPSYLQQYIKYGKPDYLEEADRQALARFYGIDEERLKPPAKKLPAVNVVGLDAKISSHLTQQHRDEEVLLRVWRKLDGDVRAAAITLLDVLTRDKAS